jgi:hypothetical protein
MQHLAVFISFHTGLLYMFRVLFAPIIRSSKNCMCNHWLVGQYLIIFETSRRRYESLIVPTITMLMDLVDETVINNLPINNTFHISYKNLTYMLILHVILAHHKVGTPLVLYSS